MPPKKSTQSYEEAMNDVQEGYIDEVRKYLRGEKKHVVSNDEFLAVYNKVLYQCDERDHNT